ncbi:hypothetical protein HD806DRAFT_125092 [Xylariaceae sp. AK1471]|nr:hypothetical protein HD806DRAFT_125092 [Xylariaceae sp. AK1471]
MASAAKSRQPRLRASCDGCFLAKVKCSKARPICSRCLACGIVCHYSPSSRAGKPKSDSSHNSHSPSHHDVQQMHSLIDDKSITYSTLQQTPHDHMFPIETGWATPPTSVEGSMSRNPSLATGLSLLGVDERTLNDQDPMSAPPDLYSATMPWTPPTDIPCTVFPDMPVTAAHMQGSHGRSQSFDATMSMPLQWADPTPHDMVSYSQVQTPTGMASNYFSSPNTTPINYSTISYQQNSPTTTNGGSCTCFTICLQSLQALHNASTPGLPPFDLVLSLNRKAVEGCAAMLACTKCFSRSGAHTATMLLATIIGKITSFYRTATHSLFETGTMTMFESTPGGSMSSGHGVSFGAYQLNGEDGKWFELEILARELRKLEEVYVRFREVCTDVSDDSEVTKAMIGYLGQNLGSTLEIISHRKDDATFVV